MSTNTWIRKGLDLAKLPRVKLNNIQDLPGAKKKVIEYDVLYIIVNVACKLGCKSRAWSRL